MLSHPKKSKDDEIPSNKKEGTKYVRWMRGLCLKKEDEFWKRIEYK